MAVEVGAQILEAGGNVVDAAIGTAFMQMAVDPFNCGIGGMGTCQVYLASKQEHVQIDFHGRAGSNVKPDMWARDMRGRPPISRASVFDDYRSELGYSSIMVPGTPAGLCELYRRYASIPLSELVGPAIRTLREGFPVYTYLAEQFKRRSQEGAPDFKTRIRATEACARTYLKRDGTLYDEGELLRNSDMADVFELLARDGLHSFYSGCLAETVAEDLAANGSFVTRDDLANYRVRIGTPVKGCYRGYTVASNPPPGGGSVVIEMLHILEGFDLGRLEHNGVEHLHLLTSAMKLAHADRNAHMGDAEYVDVPLDTVFLSRQHAQRHQETIRLGGESRTTAPSGEEHTTHLVVMNQLGDVVTMTHTLGSASGVTTPGLGFIYNNSMYLADPVPGGPNSLAPGKARISGMCPTIAFREGRPVLALGAPGGSVIMSAVLQCLCNSIDWCMSPVEAVGAPRIHCEGEEVHIESRIRRDYCSELEKCGHQVIHRVEAYARDFARAQLVHLDEEGELRGGSDPRGGGGSVAYPRS